MNARPHSKRQSHRPGRARPLSSRMRRLLRRLGRDRSGSTAVEFAIIAMPFLAMTFALLETGITLASAMVLENSVSRASRKLYTGEFQKANAATSDPSQLADLFKKEVCQSVSLFDCLGTLKVDVRPFSEFPTGDMSVKIINREIDPSFGGFQPIKSGDIVLVRAAAGRTVITAMWHPAWPNLTGNRRLITASNAFRAENY